MKKKVLFAMITMLLILSCIVWFLEDEKMKYDNVTDKATLINQTYSSAEIKELKIAIDSGNMNFAKFKRKFDVQCIRKTHQGYYAVLLQDDGKSIFVFIDDEFQVDNMMIVDTFKSQKDFELFISEGTTLDEMIAFDESTIFLLYGADMTAHVVREGVVIVNYVRVVDGKFLGKSIVGSVEFIENEKMVTSEDEFVRKNIPFILEIDKRND